MNKSSSKALRLKAEFFLSQVRRFFLIIIIVTILGSATGGAISAIKYSPEYTVSQAFSIDLKNTNQKNNALTNSQLSKTVPSLFSSSVFMKAMQPYIDEKGCSGKFRVASISSTNLFCLYVVGPSNTDCEAIIEIFKDHYSEVADEIIGKSSLNYFTNSSSSVLPSNSPHYARFILMGGLGCLLVALSLIYIKSILSNPITSQQDAEEFINAKCLATIKTFNTKKRSNDKKIAKHKMPLINNNECPLELKQSISTIATKVEVWCKEKNLNTILFTSTISGEGKSSIALNTAIELASKGKRILIIDADLRSPSISKYFGIENESNRISDVIEEKIKIDDSFERIDELYVLSNYEPDAKAFESVTSNAFSEMVKFVKSQFDYVIIDTPPVGMLSDAISISDIADAYIYVISFNYVSKHSVQQGLHSLTGTNSQPIGFILNYEN